MAHSDEDQLKRINLSIARWKQERDAGAVEQLDDIISPELVFRRADKTVAGKQEFMAGLREPSPFCEARVRGRRRGSARRPRPRHIDGSDDQRGWHQTPVPERSDADSF